MTPDRWAVIDSLFQEALALPPERRNALLAERCADDSELRSEVESMLANDRSTDAFLVDLIREQERHATGWDIWPAGTRIGDYNIERLLGAGGMGAVYLASRADGEFDHRVAIKFANSLSATDWTAQRFRTERRILARLAHPNITRLLGGGTAPNGSPYLVMEYVEGEPVTTWCHKHSAGLRQRLKLFLGVCDAVAHAHRNLVVHRDIKPANILVTASGAPKLLDFGISKVYDPETAGLGPATTRIMTVGYASPEQVMGHPITTSTDVYSLGVVLYELLSGRAPFPTEQYSPAAIPQAICESDPCPPSAVPGSLCPKGDLQHIIRKAMHKEPRDRYSSVEQMAADIRAYLESRPVIARAGTPWYRLSRFLRRHHTAAVAALVIGLASSAIAAKWVADARRMAQFYRELRTASRAYLSEAPNRLAEKPAMEVRREIGKLFDEQMRPVLARHGSDSLAVREIALAYEALANQTGIVHEHAAGMLEDALYFYERAIEVLQPLYALRRTDTHGAVILARSYCGAARIKQRLGNAAVLVSAVRDYEECLGIQRRTLGHSGPAPKGLFAREYVLTHIWFADYRSGSGDVAGARELLKRAIDLAQRQQRADPRAFIWESKALLRLARLAEGDGNHAESVRLVRLAFERFATAKANPPRMTIDLRLAELELAAARVRVGDSPSDSLPPLARALKQDYPHHPLAAEVTESQ
jgi:tetratricopeptide (TPR) repeat protein